MRKLPALWVYVALVLALAGFLLVRDRIYWQWARGTANVYHHRYRFQQNRLSLQSLSLRDHLSIILYQHVYGRRRFPAPPPGIPEDRRFLVVSDAVYDSAPAWRYAENHPDRPEYFWWAWYRDGWFHRKGEFESLFGRPLTDDELARLRAEREREPDNGLNYWEEAYHEAVLGFKATRPPVVHETVDPERAAAAARLLREAVAAPRYTRYAGGVERDIHRWMGEAETMNDLLHQYLYFAAQPTFNLGGLRQFAEAMLHFARERAESPEHGLDDARAIIDDLHEWSIRVMMSGPTLLEHLIGLAVHWVTLEKGVPILRGAGDEESAERLLRRTLSLFRPYVVYLIYCDLDNYVRYADLDPDDADRETMREWNYVECSLLDLDPTLLDEAHRYSLPDTPRDALIHHIPAMHHVLFAGRPLADLTDEALARSRAFEYAALFRFVSYVSLVLLLAALGLMMAGYCLVGRRTSPSDDSVRLARKNMRHNVIVFVAATILLLPSVSLVYFTGAEKRRARADTLIIPRMDDEFVGIVGRIDYLIVKDNLDFLRARISEMDSSE